MPATFAHCLMAREAITRLGKAGLYPGVLKDRNQFVVMGAAGPDYPYLTDVLKSTVMHIGHNWANRMHYEHTGGFIRAGIEHLSQMDKKSDKFKNCLSWLSGYMSHVVADAYMHPVVNSTVNGTYLFTQTEHGRCELVQDIYIFNLKTGTDICKAAATDSKTFGYLNILDDCSDPTDPNRLHPHIRSFWSETLKAAHPNATAYFEDIDPDTWHKNYKKRVDFAADGRSIFRHTLDVVNAPRYVQWSEVEKGERAKYIDNVSLPGGSKLSYEKVFNQAIDRIVSTWNALFPYVEDGKVPSPTLVKDWNLDTGVDESKIDLWEA